MSAIVQVWLVEQLVEVGNVVLAEYEAVAELGGRLALNFVQPLDEHEIAL